MRNKKFNIFYVIVSVIMRNKKFDILDVIVSVIMRNKKFSIFGCDSIGYYEK
jgi:hypothetical protein